MPILACSACSAESRRITCHNWVIVALDSSYNAIVTTQLSIRTSRKFLSLRLGPGKCDALMALRSICTLRLLRCHSIHYLRNAFETNAVRGAGKLIECLGILFFVSRAFQVHLKPFALEVGWFPFGRDGRAEAQRDIDQRLVPLFRLDMRRRSLFIRVEMGNSS